MKYRAVKKNGYGECVSNDINYIINNVEKWCGSYFDLYVDDVKVDNPKEYLAENKPKTLEDKIVDMCFKIDSLQQENERLKEIEKEHQKINGELREENKKLKEIMETAKSKSIRLQNRYGYILDDLTFLLDKVEEN